MTDLIDFLRARLDEDDRAAESAIPWETGSRYEGQPLDWQLFLNRYPPGRMRAEVEAKRQILNEHVACNCDTEWSVSHCPRCDDAEPCQELRLLALPYSGHPDYRAEEWAP